jgi:predicted metal-dependent phosphoesterase TrpH
MPVDLHAHSRFSDGTDSPEELVTAAAAAGLTTVALTDHDTMQGVPEALATGERLGVTVVPGVELSCMYEGIPLHLLGYWPDPADPAFAAELVVNRDDRLPRAQEITRRLGAAGIPVTWSDVERATPPGATVGRPHIADALVAVGVVADRGEAFAVYLNNGTPYYVPQHSTPPVRGVELIVAAGGVPVIAHPGASKRGTVVPDSLLAEMADAGMAAVEVNHPDHDSATRGHYRALAKELGLLVTGSSDYHGTGKTNRLGQEITDPIVYEALAARARSTGAQGRQGAHP